MNIKTTRHIIMLKSEHLDDKWVRVDDEKKRIYYYLENLDNVICYLERIKIPDGNKTLLDLKELYTNMLLHYNELSQSNPSEVALDKISKGGRDTYKKATKPSFILFR